MSDTTVNGASIATVNPFRYRGYYYDTDTGLYYLQSRYYDPVVGRFINADEPSVLSAYTGILSYNLYAYCENDTINMYDSKGYGPYQLFTSALDAVIDFAYNYFNVSAFLKMEISSLLYYVKKKKKTYYAYTPYIVGDVHRCWPTKGKKYIPRLGSMLGGIHTHPIETSFSDADYNWANDNGVFYLISPDRTIKVCYNNVGERFFGKKDQVVSSFQFFRKLGYREKEILKTAYYYIWENHLKEGCSRHKCNRKRKWWPGNEL